MEDIDAAVAALREGRVVAAATETFFGLLADATRAEAIDRVFALKGRDAAKGSALLAPGLDEWRALVASVPPTAERLANAFWPGPLTIALPARAGLDPRLVIDGTVGVRVPGPSVAARIVEAFGGAVTATSANRSGAPPAAKDDDVRATFADAVARGELEVVTGVAPGGAPSTIVAVSGAAIRIVREGAVARDEIERVAGAG